MVDSQRKKNVRISVNRGGMPVCAACGVDCPRAEFTGAQLKKKDKRKCRGCVDAAAEPDGAAQASNADLLEAAGISTGAR